MVKKGATNVPQTASVLQEIEDTHRQKVNFLVENSSYNIKYLMAVDFSEFYELILLVEANLKKKNKQL